MVAAKWARLKHGSDGFRGNQYKSGKSPIGDSPQTETATRNKAAELLKVGTTSIDRAKRIPEMIRLALSLASTTTADMTLKTSGQWLGRGWRI